MPGTVLSTGHSLSYSGLITTLWVTAVIIPILQTRNQYKKGVDVGEVS